MVLPGGRALLVDAGGVAPLTTGPDAFDAPPGFDIGDRVVAIPFPERRRRSGWTASS